MDENVEEQVQIARQMCMVFPVGQEVERTSRNIVEQ